MTSMEILLAQPLTGAEITAAVKAVAEQDNKKFWNAGPHHLGQVVGYDHCSLYVIPSRDGKKVQQHASYNRVFVSSHLPGAGSRRRGRSESIERDVSRFGEALKRYLSDTDTSLKGEGLATSPRDEKDGEGLATSPRDESVTAVLPATMETPAKAAQLLKVTIADWNLAFSVEEKAPAIIAFVMTHAVTRAVGQTKSLPITVKIQRIKSWGGSKLRVDVIGVDLKAEFDGIVKSVVGNSTTGYFGFNSSSGDNPVFTIEASAEKELYVNPR